MGTTTDAVPSWADRRLDAAAAVGRLRESWAWLDELREPGPETSVGRVLTDADRARQAAAAVADRAQRAANLRLIGDREPGQSPPWWALPQGGDESAFAPAAAPVRLAVIDLQVYLAGRVRRIVARVAGRSRLPRREVPRYLDWLDGPAFDLFDVAPGGTLIWATSELQRLDELARHAAGVVTDRLAPLPDRCPACRRRSLQLDYTDGNRNAWSVRCTSARCLCTGPGCPCRHRVRYEGRHHAWSYGELDGPFGLWAAIAAATVPRPPILHTKDGHGGRP